MRWPIRPATRPRALSVPVTLVVAVVMAHDGFGDVVAVRAERRRRRIEARERVEFRIEDAAFLLRFREPAKMLRSIRAENFGMDAEGVENNHALAHARALRASHGS